MSTAVELKMLVIPTVMHVGRFDDSRRGYSLEGHHLSVSHCPEAWVNLARSDGDVWVMRKPGAVFVDAISLKRTARLAIEGWALENGILESAMIYRAWGYDCELDHKIFSSHRTKAEALEEADADGRVTQVLGIVSTARLDAAVGQDPSLDTSAFDYALMVWAEAHGFDGMWWREKYDVMSLSAPRGCIFRSRVHEWKRRATPWDMHEGDPFLNRTPKPIQARV